MTALGSFGEVIRIKLESFYSEKSSCGEFMKKWISPAIIPLFFLLSSACPKENRGIPFLFAVDFKPLESPGSSRR